MNTSKLVLENGNIFDLQDEIIVLGRGEDCQIKLADTSVSRKHAELKQLAAGMFSISDLGSTNGTFLNGKLIKPNVYYEVQPGDRLKIGKLKLTIKNEEEKQEPNQTTTNNFIYANFGLRLGAYLIDCVVLTIILPIINTVILTPLFATQIRSNSLSMESVLLQVALIPICNILFVLFYYACLESSKYQGTIGKILLKIKVVDLQGAKISFLRAVGHYFGRILSSVIFLIGYFMAAFTEKKQTLHDILSGCLVVKK